MSTEIVLPRIGMTMTEATVLEWVVADGDRVEAGEVLFRLETDKVESDCDAPATGTVRHAVEAGTVCPVGMVIGRIDSDE